MKRYRFLMTLALCGALLLSCRNSSAPAESVEGENATATEAVAVENEGITVLEDKTSEDGVRTISVKPSGICSRQINVSVKADEIVKVEFVGGCPGNTQGVSILVQGMKVKDAISKLKGINCGNKGTSCPDRLASTLSLFLK